MEGGIIERCTQFARRERSRLMGEMVGHAAAHVLGWSRHLLRPEVALVIIATGAVLAFRAL